MTHCGYGAISIAMAQFPLHPLGTRAEGVQWKLQHLCRWGAMEIAPSQWKLHHSWAIK